MTAAFLEQEPIADQQARLTGVAVPLKTDAGDRGLEWLRANVVGSIGVNREAAIINGVILAEEGPFKTPGRGEFDKAAIKQIVKLAKSKKGGLKSRFGHPSGSGDHIGKLLGRVHNVRADVIKRGDKELSIVRGDLHFDKTALEPPPDGGTPYGVYLMNLAESDPDAFGTSLVLKADQAWRLDKHKQPVRDEQGVELPPLWMPTELHASDVVDEGDATNSALSIEGLPDSVLRRGVELLDQQFAGKPRQFVRARLLGFVDRYLSLRYEEDEPEPARTTVTVPPQVDQTPDMSGTDAMLLDIYIAIEGE